MDDKTRTVIGVTCIVVGVSVMTISGCFMIENIIKQRRMIKAFAEQTGMSYEDAKQIVKAHQKGTSHDAAFELFVKKFVKEFVV